MDSKKTLEVLKKIKYPGFSRDIVSFGIVDDLQIDNNNLKLSLKLSSVSESVKNEIIDRIKNVVNDFFDNISFEIVGEKKQQAQTIGSELIPNVKNTIAVASGKGGVGKSTVAVNIATDLMLKGFKVGILDLDIYGPSLPILLNVNEKPNMTENNKLVPLEKHNMKIMSFGFLSGNDSPVIWRGPMVARMTEQFFRDVEWGDLDYLILDLPPGTGDIQLTLTQKIKITGAIIVTTPQDIALADVRKGADMFKKVNTPVIGVVENMSGLILNGTTNIPDSKIIIDNQDIKIKSNGSFQLNIDIFDKGGGEKESERLGVPLLARIPLSKQIMLATDCGEPLVMQKTVGNVGTLYLDLAQKLDLIISNKLN